jgi:hypothetical protein
MTTLQLGSALARAWIRLYTLGLPRELRDARGEEIAADMLEQERDGRDSGASPAATAVNILLRAVLGVADDLSWRVEALQARRVALLDRRTAMLPLTSRQIRWMGLGGLVGGLLWSARYIVPVEPAATVRGYGHIALAMLLVLGVVGFFAQQRAGTGRTALVGFTLLLTSLLSWFVLNVLGTVFGVDGKTLAMNILGLLFVFLMAPGFLLLGFGMRGAARRIPLAIGAVFALWMFLPRGLLLRWFPSATDFLRPRGDSPLGIMVFFLMGIALAIMGYSVLRQGSRGASKPVT